MCISARVVLRWARSYFCKEIRGDEIQRKRLSRAIDRFCE